MTTKERFGSVKEIYASHGVDVKSAKSLTTSSAGDLMLVLRDRGYSSA